MTVTVPPPRDPNSPAQVLKQQLTVDCDRRQQFRVARRRRHFSPGHVRRRATRVQRRILGGRAFSASNTHPRQRSPPTTWNRSEHQGLSLSNVNCHQAPAGLSSISESSPLGLPPHKEASATDASSLFETCLALSCNPSGMAISRVTFPSPSSSADLISSGTRLSRPSGPKPVHSFIPAHNPHVRPW